MIVISNKIQANQVRKETENGTEFLVAPVVLARSMELNGGFLPSDEIKASAERWAGVPVPIDHPTHSGDPISINDDRADVPVIGEVRNPEAKRDGEFLTGELWVNVEAARAAGKEGERVLARIQNGDAVEVSTGHVPGRVVSGVFDGEHRDAATLDIQPDHLAVLPNDKGKCSIADHCGAGAPVAPVANRVMVANMADDGSGLEVRLDPQAPEDMDDASTMLHNVLDRARTPDFTGTETTSWADVSKTLTAVTSALDIDADTVEDLTDGQREEIASHTLLGDPDAESWRELFFFPVVNPNTDSLNRGALMAVRSGRGESADIPQDALESAQNVAGNLLEEEFDADVTDNSLRRAYNALKDVFGESDDTTIPAESGADNTTPMSDTLENESMIEELAANTEFDRENLEAWDGTDCLANLYESHVANDGGGEPEEPTQDTEQPASVDVEAVVDELESRFEDKFLTADELSDAISANKEQEQKEALASDIVANSDEYEDTEAVIEDYPTVAALETKREDVTATPMANWGATRPATPSGGSDGQPSFSPVATAHEALSESDD